MSISIQPRLLRRTGHAVWSLLSLAFLLLLGLALALGSARPLSAQQAELQAPTAAETDSRLADVEARLATARERLAALPPGIETAPGDEASPVQEDTGGELSVALRQEIENLERIRLSLSEQQSAHRHAGELENERSELEREIAENVAYGVGHDPPYTLLELDDLLDRLDAVAASRASQSTTLDVQKEAAAAAAERLGRAERERRQTKESLDAAGEASRALELRRELVKRQSAEAAALEDARLITLQLENDRRALALSETRERALAAAVEWLRGRLQPTDGDLREALSRFTEEDEALERRVEKARRDLDEAEAVWTAIQQRVATATGGGADPGLLAQSDARRAEVAAARQRIDVLEDHRQRLTVLEEVTEKRYRWLRGEIAEREARRALRDELADTTASFERAARRLQSLLDQSRADVVEIETRLGEISADSPALRWRRIQRDVAHDMVELYQDELTGLGRELAQVRRPLKVLDDELSKVRFSERLASWWELLVGIWDYEIVVVQDSSITLGKIILALLLVIGGHMLSRRLARLFERRILKRFGLAEGAVAAIQTMTYYLLLLGFFFWALKLVNIPLTVFTFLGGALAIGVGFGSQNIVNNFMSGLILMVERPVKVGDLIELEGTNGRVEQIGARSTRILSGDNTHIIVPNSVLLESSVLNWTLSDNVVRVRVEIGVAYGSDTTAVVRELERSLVDCKRVLEEPEPEILFIDFGDNSLLFRTLFWTRVGAPGDRSRAQSALRFLIDRYFAEAGIVIAFPQRDIHLDTLRPLEIRLRREAAARDE